MPERKHKAYAPYSLARNDLSLGATMHFTSSGDRRYYRPGGHRMLGAPRMTVHLINPSDNSFGTAVITPRWLFVLAAATPRSMGDPTLVDESIEQLDPETIHAGDIVGIS